VNSFAELILGTVDPLGDSEAFVRFDPAVSVRRVDYELEFPIAKHLLKVLVADF
jgi:hypothetical protein